MDDVRKGLEAAGQALANRQAHLGLCFGFPCGPGCSCVEEAATAIAAFLRAMNPHDRRAGFNLACDVEEAAKEPRP